MSQIIANPDPIKVISRASECVRRLMEAGLTFGDLQKPIDDRFMRQRLVRFWQFNGYEPSIEQKLAQEIMGENYIGPEVAIKDFGAKFAKKMITYSLKFRFLKALFANARILMFLFWYPNFPFWISETK